ncbi:MAG: BTAD domain-containing putative transcriptional regulator [Chloroflexota bacterium]
MLKIKLLGKTIFQFTEGDNTPFRKSLRLGVLGYLIRMGQPISRKRLSKIFLPDLPDQDARTYLRNILARLKNDFTPYLVVTRNSVHFDVSKDCWVDLLELEEVLAKFSSMYPAEMTAEDADNLRTALQLYNGPFLGEFSRQASDWFEEWVGRERQAILNKTLEGYSKLIHYSIHNQDWKQGMEDAKMMISLDQSRQIGWLLLMKCLASSGDLRRAQEAYERYERSPSADLQSTSTGREMNLLYRKIGQRISGINLNFDNDDDSLFLS